MKLRRYLGRDLRTILENIGSMWPWETIEISGDLRVWATTEFSSLLDKDLDCPVWYRTNIEDYEVGLIKFRYFRVFRRSDQSRAEIEYCQDPEPMFLIHADQPWTEEFIKRL